MTIIRFRFLLSIDVKHTIAILARVSKLTSKMLLLRVNQATCKLRAHYVSWHLHNGAERSACLFETCPNVSSFHLTQSFMLVTTDSEQQSISQLATSSQRAKSSNVSHHDNLTNTPIFLAKQDMLTLVDSLLTVRKINI